MSSNERRKHIDDFIERIKSGRASHGQVHALYEAIRSGDRAALSKGITLVESDQPGDRPYSHELLQLCLAEKYDSRRIAITGTPGSGKSTFINTYARILVENGSRVAILSVDPSSYLSGGSILGDKTRMDDLSGMDEIFIRPSASGKTLGGVHERTREAIILCEAAGYDTILVETVGVGQSEYRVEQMTDMLMLLLLPGAGDELQGIKKGITEVADLIVINKADLFNHKQINETITDYRQALHLSLPDESSDQWTPRIESASGIEKHAVNELHQIVDEYFRHIRLKGFYSKQRQAQWQGWFEDSLGWAVREVLKERGLNTSTYYPDAHELPPAKAFELIRQKFSS